MKLKSIFRIIQGHQITDEEIYKSSGLGNIPIYTSSNETKGYWDKAIINEQDLPCITYPSKANSGEAFIQDKLFDANNTAVLIPFPEWRKQLILEWVCLKLSTVFLDIATSKEGVSYLNREIVEEYDLEVPSIEIQEKELSYYKKLNSLKDSIESIRSEVNKLIQVNLLTDNVPQEQIKLSKVFNYTSRNDALSEEGIYSRSQGLEGAKEIIKVISGSTDNFYGKIPLDYRLHIVKGKPCLQVITRGHAGQIKFVDRGNYATNTNSMLLTIQEEQKGNLHIFDENQEEQMLKFFRIYLQPIFYEYCSSADLSVFPLTEAINEIMIPNFKFNKEIVEIVSKYDTLFFYDEKTSELLKNLNRLVGMQIINN